MICKENAKAMVGPEGRQTPTGTALKLLDSYAPSAPRLGPKGFNRLADECPTIRSGFAIRPRVA